MVEITIKSSQRVTGVEAGKIVLSDNDQLMGIIPVVVMVYYSRSDNMEFSSMKASLQKLLEYYPTMTGKLIFRPSGGVDIQCSNEGALMIEASADGALSEINILENQIPLSIYTPMDLSTPTTEPVCKFQLTYFTDGGLAIGFTGFHCILDGTSLFEFLTNWGAMHRGQPILVPVENRSLLISEGNPPSMEHEEFFVRPPAPPVSDSDPKPQPPPAPVTKSIIAEFPVEILNKLKEDCSVDLPEGSWISTNDALSALIWQRILTVRGHNDEDIVKLGMACNARSLRSPPLPKGYFGNVNFFICVKSTKQEIVSSTLSQVAWKIRQGVMEITPEKIQSSLDFVHSQPDPSKVIPGFVGPTGFAMTSWNKFPMYDIDFAGFAPRFIGIPPLPFSGLALMLDTPKRDGSIYVQIGLEASHMNALLVDEIWNKYRPQ